MKLMRDLQNLCLRCHRTRRMNWLKIGILCILFRKSARDLNNPSLSTLCRWLLKLSPFLRFPWLRSPRLPWLRKRDTSARDVLNPSRIKQNFNDTRSSSIVDVLPHWWDDCLWLSLFNLKYPLLACSDLNLPCSLWCWSESCGWIYVHRTRSHSSWRLNWTSSRHLHPPTPQRFNHPTRQQQHSRSTCEPPCFAPQKPSWSQGQICVYWPGQAFAAVISSLGKSPHPAPQSNYSELLATIVSGRHPHAAFLC